MLAERKTTMTVKRLELETTMKTYVGGRALDRRIEVVIAVVEAPPHLLLHFAFLHLPRTRLTFHHLISTTYGPAAIATIATTYDHPLPRRHTPSQHHLLLPSPSMPS
jgi:hypothetical protein